jgi:hypothetical protein
LATSVVEPSEGEARLHSSSSSFLTPKGLEVVGEGEFEAASDDEDGFGAEGG